VVPIQSESIKKFARHASSSPDSGFCYNFRLTARWTVNIDLEVQGSWCNEGANRFRTTVSGTLGCPAIAADRLTVTGEITVQLEKGFMSGWSCKKIALTLRGGSYIITIDLQTPVIFANPWAKLSGHVVEGTQHRGNVEFDIDIGGLVGTLEPLLR
jgi:hypothetical protein